MTLTRRKILIATAGTAAYATARFLGQEQPAQATVPATRQSPQSDRIFICNEDSNTLSVINPLTNQVDSTPVLMKILGLPSGLSQVERSPPMLQW